jgi:hypothetical protein
LAQRTQADRAHNGFPPKRPILVRTGKLRKGFKQQGVSDKEGRIENKVFYAKFHQSGTRIMPQRKIVGTTRKSEKAIQLTFANFIVKEIKKVFK